MAPGPSDGESPAGHTVDTDRAVGVRRDSPGPVDTPGTDTDVPSRASACRRVRGPSSARVPPGEALRVHIVCFNFETVQVTWDDTERDAGTNLTFFYR